MTGRRPRGHYSPLICTRCRTRKIKCILPAQVTRASNTPQPANLACERCRKNGFDCIVGQTTLGRPGGTLTSGGRSEVSSSMRTSADRSAGEVEVEALDSSGFLLSRPYEDEGGDGDAARKISPEEVCEALSTPLRFLTVLLARYPGFGKPTSHREWSGSGPIPIITDSMCEDIEPKLVWLRLYHPYIPRLRTLRDRLAAGSAVTSTTCLLALLCLLALDTSSILRDQYRSSTEQLRHVMYHHGQATLMNPPTHPDTVTFFQLVAEYRPLALVNSPLAAAGSLTDSSYLKMAKQVAIDLQMDHIEEDGTTPILETIQWIHLHITIGYSSFVVGKSDIGHDWIIGIRSAISHLEYLLEVGTIPSEALWLTISLFNTVRATRARTEMVRKWKDLDSLRTIIHTHAADCTAFRTKRVAALQSWDSVDKSQADAIISLLDAEMHKNHLSIKQSAMFFAVMTSSYSRETPAFDSSEITQISDHVVAHLKAPPTINQAHAFMAEFGATTADELEKQLTDFIHHSEVLRLDDVPFTPPTKTMTSEVLHTCYQLVQQNAARLKGWGALHDRVDTHIIVIRECARQLEVHAREEGIMQPAAALVRDLQGILSRWKTRLCENSRSTSSQSPLEPAPEPATTTSVPNLSSHVTRSRGEEGNQLDSVVAQVDPTPGLWAQDLFAEWQTWPQPEDIDFSQFIDFDYDPTVQ